MRVIYITHGSRGDVVPHAALARGLVVEGGHTVRMVVPEEYAPLIPNELQLIPHPLSLTEFMRYAEMHGAQPGICAPEEIEPLYGEYLYDADRLAKMMASLERPLHDWADVVIASCGQMLWLSMTLAQLYGTGLVIAAVQEIIPTSASFGAPSPPPAFLNLVLHRHVMRHVVQPAAHRAVLNEWRVQRGMRAMPDPWEHAHVFNPPALIGLSPLVFPPPPDYSRYDCEVVGTWIGPEEVPAAASALLPAEVEDFLRAGDPPVYIGWGSMPYGDRLTEVAVRAAQLAGKRAILLRGTHQLAHAHVRLELLDSSTSDARALREWAARNILVVDDVSHAALFPRVACIVHHGGSGTTAAALRSGVPSFAMPFGMDQFAFARASAARGVGPVTVLPALQWTAAALADALSEATGRPAYTAAATALRRALLAEPSGITRAVRAFERMGRRRPYAEAAAREHAYVVAPPYRWWWPLATLVFTPPRSWLPRASAVAALGGAAVFLFARLAVRYRVP